MSKSTKIWLITASSLLLIGVIILVGVMAMLEWDFSKLSTNKFETNKYKIAESYKNICINIDTADIIFELCEDDSCEVICYEQKNVNHTVKVESDSLLIEVNDTRKWYEHIGFSFGSPKITVRLPLSEYGSLSMHSSTGKVKIPDTFKFDNVNISASTGDVECLASAKGDIKIKTSTGKISLNGLSADSLDIKVSTGNVNLSDVSCNGDIRIEVSTGKAHLTNVTCKSLISDGSTGDISLNGVVASEKFSIERSTGDIKFNGSDASEIFIETDTGDIEGSLLSDKVFITKTDTGRISVPNSITGGKCEIETSTGDIKITIE